MRRVGDRRSNGRHFRFPNGQRSGLVENHGGDFPGLFQRHAVADQNAAARGGVGAGHDGGGRRQTHRARTRHNQNRRGNDESRRRAGRGHDVPEKWREQVVNVFRRFRHESPPQRGGDGDGDDDRHEDAAHAVAEALDVGAAGLGALHGGDDVRQRGAFAGGRHAHDEPAIQIHRAGVKFAAGFFVHRHRFAGEHGLVHGGIAFGHHAIHRHPVAGAQRDQIADFQFGDGNFNFGFRISDFGLTKSGVAVCGARFSTIFQRARRAQAHAGLQPVAEADERDDGGGFHEIEMAAHAAQQRPRAVAKRGRRTERDERVHVRAADFELVPRAAIKFCPGKNLHHPGQRKGKPLKPRLHAEAENPFANHQRGGNGDAEPEIDLPVRVFGFAAGGSVGLDFLCRVTGFLNGLDDGGNILLRAGIPAHRCAAGFEQHRGAAHAGHALNRLGDVPRAVVAVHAADKQFRRAGAVPGIRFNLIWRRGAAHTNRLSRSGAFVEFRLGGSWRLMSAGAGLARRTFPFHDASHVAGQWVIRRLFQRERRQPGSFLPLPGIEGRDSPG